MLINAKSGDKTDQEESRTQIRDIYIRLIGSVLWILFKQRLKNRQDDKVCFEGALQIYFYIKVHPQNRLRLEAPNESYGDSRIFPEVVPSIVHADIESA